jgi:hypothetical protein
MLDRDRQRKVASNLVIQGTFALIWYDMDIDNVTLHRAFSEMNTEWWAVTIFLYHIKFG